MRKEETMEYKLPMPLADEGFFEGVVIDDHLGSQLMSRHGWKKN